MGGEVIVYCQRCGKQNEDGAQFCNKCGASLVGPRVDYKKRREEECDEECAASGRSAPAFWGILVLLVGLLILIEVIKNIFEDDLPEWFMGLNLWWLIGLVIALAIILAGIRMFQKSR
ncbi:MAG: zinc ribbon domain-containing protein [Thermoplasmata archaeon]|nr:MAG: zinc ribbon domain-containing protein [Thermoplasmata archaeon]